MRRLLVGFTLLVSLASATVHYKLTPLPTSHSIAVSITIDAPKTSEIFHIPAWCPGYYQIADYQKKVYDLHASDDSGALAVQKVDARTWKVQPTVSGKLTFTYKVLGDDPGLGFFAVNVADDKVFVNGAAGFMYVEGRKKENITLRVQNPVGWDIATAMDASPDGNRTAGGYDEFIDHPIQLGKFQVRSFKIGNIPFDVIFVSPNNKINCDMDAETERLRVVSIPALNLFGAASFKRYLYILHLEIGNFSGGLEHRACNVQAVANSPELHLDDLAAHEYFHAWNVKQIRPAILGPFDYTQPQRTANLWFAEGVTDYYAKLHTYQSGLQNEAWLRHQFVDQIQQLQNGTTRRIKTVEEASRACWDSDGFGLGDLSYYTKGLLAGLIFDAAIIDATNGHKTLDDVMRLLYLQHKLPNPGYGEDDLRVAINDVAGTDLSALYNKMIRSTDEMPYGLLKKVGILVSLPNNLPDFSSDGPQRKNFYDFEPNPTATQREKSYYQTWLHRLQSVHE